jgi:hypothetical protein
MLNFMSDDHHLVRKFVVGELPGFGKPVPPVLISEELEISLSKTIEFLKLHFSPFHNRLK